ncbi:MAG: Na+/H+ antiporter subunit E [Myxococcota bacterium]|nr:Na+/H+ antiporter subunit E [Myxococcota bacterium]
MKSLVWTLVLALAWCAVTGELTALNLLVGFVLGHLAMSVPPGGAATSRYFSKLRKLAEFAFFFARELFASALRVAYDVLTPTHHMRPAVLGVPLEVSEDAEITLLANLISLTPGSLALELSTDRRVLFVHFMYVDDPDATIAHVKVGYERRVMELLR